MGERNWWAFSFRWRGWGAVLVLAVGWLALFSLGLLVWAFSGAGLLSNGLLAGVFVALVVIGSGRFLGMGVDCWWGAFVCLVRALAVGGFVGARGHWRGTIFCLLWSWWFWGVDCVARGIRCVVRNWF